MPSTSTSYTPTVTSGGGQQKLNVVTRVAIEGKSKRDQDGASVKMFLKIVVPLDYVTPGSTIPLFPEENVKILTSQVHPLDNNSVPYNFSSTISPMLHAAARALNLPARSSETFNSAFDLEKSNGRASSSRISKSDNPEHVLPIDAQYTGHILVSGYNISFVLPKVFLSRRKGGGLSETEEEAFTRTPGNRRRPSVGERNQAQFMAAIDLWIPLLSKPPRSPYLLAIPTPRCLHNHIKLRIFPPANTSQSFASLSSMEEESGAWDVTSDPHVTRSASSRSRSRSHNNFADDESSDASISGMYEGCAIQGTFPSAERIRVRWAKPMRTVNISGETDGRKRVGVESVKGEMVCTIRGKGANTSNPDVEGVLMDVVYKSQCKGVWFPGVATMLGLDLGLEAKGAEITWPQGHPTQWEVSGGAGYTGFDNGTSTVPPSSRTTSFDSNGPQPQGEKEGESVATYQTARTNSAASSSSSLLRAPLPGQSVADYSFEGSNATLPPGSVGSLSSVPSLPTSSTPNPLSTPQIRPPGSPITLHLNMNELQTPSKSIFSFSISGTILVTAKSTLARINSLNSSNGSNNDKSTDPEPVPLPQFTVLAADSESTPIIVRNEVEGASVEVFHPTGDIQRDPQTRKTVLHKTGSTRCADGGRIALKYFEAFGLNGNARPSGRPRTPSNVIARVGTNSPAPRTIVSARARKDGPPIITSVEATVTILAPDINGFPTGYAVRVTLKMPILLESEWLDFGLAYGYRSGSDNASPSAAPRPSPKLHIICASLDGVPVKSEIEKAIANAVKGAAPFEEVKGKEWIYWGKVYAGSSVGSSMVIDYVVQEQASIADKGKKKAPKSAQIDILLPSFSISVARLDVKIDATRDLELSSLRSNFDYHHAFPAYNRLLLYSIEEFSQPRLSFALVRKTRSSESPGFKWYFAFTWTMLFTAFLVLYNLTVETNRMQKISSGYSNMLVDSWPEVPTVTETTTVYRDTSGRKWFGDLEASFRTISPSSLSASVSSTTFPAVTSPAFSVAPTITEFHVPSQPREDNSVVNMQTRSILERYGLIPIESFLSSDWLDEQSSAFKRAFVKVQDSMEFVWRIFKRVYHYPLPPP
ncbi:hypothetical protein NLJ89_g4806 [Agrocybe chaxingu]|uniref:Uncharacterized protein n=1 Tax=Agrocybe chaxingu TaxID=84603 RepID=A0A9W8K1X4_9AGAR|nr:hypothetical protein NLJ89_g4806 [Agrocybe chaxingu]